MKEPMEFNFETYLNKRKLTNKVKLTIKTIINEFSKSQKDDLILTIEDLKNILNHNGEVFAGFYENKDIDSEFDAIKFVLKDASLNINSLNKTSAALISFVIPHKYPIKKIKKIMDLVYENIHYDATILWGTVTDNVLNENHIKIAGLFIIE
ncbi:hypothetical protein [Sulfurimonas sp.]